MLGNLAIKWFQTHGAGLGLTPNEQLVTWLALGLFFFVLAVVGTVGGRIGWALFGLLSVGLFYDAATPPDQWTSAGAAALVWAVLGVPAYRRLHAGEHPIWAALTRRRQTLDETARPSASPDSAELLGAVFELLFRRGESRARHIPITQPVTWTIVDGVGHGFRAVTADKRATVNEVVGMAYNSETLAELLFDSAFPPATTRLRWERDELRPSLGPDASDKGQESPELEIGMQAFIDSSHEQMQRLITHFREFQAEYRSDYFPEFPVELYLDNQARLLNQSRPLITAHLKMRPSSSTNIGESDATLDLDGSAEFYDWIEVRAVVKTQDLQWNGFADHRPEMTAKIADSIRVAEDLHATVRDRLSDDGHAVVTAYQGPAGPIYEVSVNGLHRTHAFALLHAPIMAAEVNTVSLPLFVDPGSVEVHSRDAVQQVQLWRGLMRRGLLEGEFLSRWCTDAEPVLCPRWVSAAWMLLGPDDASTIAAAYERAYPGSLTRIGIPHHTLGRPEQWQRWLRAN